MTSSSRSFLVLMSVLVICFFACVTHVRAEEGKGGIQMSDALYSQTAPASLLDRDFRRLQSLIKAMHEMSDDMRELQENIHGSERGYYTSDEHDRIEELLYRYIMCRETMWGLIDFHRDYQIHFNSEEFQTKSFVIGFSTAANLYYYGSLLIYSFIDSPIIIAKLNESDQRYDIPANTYDKVFRSLTDPEHIKAIRAARHLFDMAIGDQESSLAKLIDKEPEYKTLIASLTTIQDLAQSRVDKIIEKRSLLIPSVRNAIRHSEVQKLAQQALDKADNVLYAIRGLTFLKVSRLRKPGSAPFEFTPKQIQEMRALLKPGDIILTFTEGYMSNLFLPGAFKHGITYVGTIEEREKIVLENMTNKRPASQKRKIDAAVKTSKLPNGADADMVEALAEGVIFNSLEHLLTERTNRLVVWRPVLSSEEQGETLCNLFSFLYSEYDFKFDFNDAVYQCCTELIYRCFNKVGPLDLALTKRMGRQTMSADDLCNYALENGENVFECIALAVSNKSEGGNNAKVITGPKARQMLSKIMTQQ